MAALGKGTHHQPHVAESALRRSMLGRAATVKATGARGRVSGYRMVASGESVQVTFPDNSVHVFWRDDLLITGERA